MTHGLLCLAIPLDSVSPGDYSRLVCFHAAAFACMSRPVHRTRDVELRTGGLGRLGSSDRLDSSDLR
ncbi:unnamed protein product [Parajaminaea phylloscopi]